MRLTSTAVDIDPRPSDDLSRGVIPIDVPREEILIQADYRLAFEIVAAFRSESNPVESVRVLERFDDNRLLAEFTSPVLLPLGMSTSLITVEHVTFSEPDRIDFELAQPSGLLRLLQDRFTLEDADGWTRFRYDSRFGLTGWVFGWVLGQVLFKRMFKNHMRTHLAKLQEMIEARAMRSRRYPAPPGTSSNHDEEQA